MHTDNKMPRTYRGLPTTDWRLTSYSSRLPSPDGDYFHIS